VFTNTFNEVFPRLPLLIIKQSYLSKLQDYECVKKKWQVGTFLFLGDENE